MTGSNDETTGKAKGGACETDLDGLAEAWVALWQGELAGLAADPGVAAAWRQAFGLGAASLRAARAATPGAAPDAGAQATAWSYAARNQDTRPEDVKPQDTQRQEAESQGSEPKGAEPEGAAPGTAAGEPAAEPPWAAPAGAAPGHGHGDPRRGVDPAGLRSRIEELERRLAALERGTAGSSTDRRGARRRRPPA